MEVLIQSFELMSDLDDDERKTTGKTTNKRKRTLSPTTYGTKCICGNPRCDEAMEKLKKYNPLRHAYFAIPSEPKENKGRPRERLEIARARKILKRKRILAALPIPARVRSMDESYSNCSKKHFASLHLHDKIFNLCHKSKCGTTRLIDSIPAELASSLARDHDCQFTLADRYEQGDYVPLPNVAPRDFIEYANGLESRANSSTKEPTNYANRKTRLSVVSSE